jgi:hypothetical protein
MFARPQLLALWSRAGHRSWKQGKSKWSAGVARFFELRAVLFEHEQVEYAPHFLARH